MGKKIKYEDFIIISNKIHNDEYKNKHGFNHYDYSSITKENFINTNHKVVLYCNIHKFQFDINANRHLNGRGCKICSFEQRSLRVIKYSNEYVDSKLNEYNRNDIERMEDVKMCSIPIYWKCLQKKNDNICGNIWKAKPVDILSGYKIGCPKCNKYEKITNEIVDKRLRTTGRDHLIQRFGDTINISTPIKWKCKVENCNHEWKTSPGNIFNGKTGCPKCNFSKGVLDIEKYLKENKYNYGFEYWFDDLVNPLTGAILYFDFVVYNKDEILCLIEYQGEFHYHPKKLKNRKIISKNESEKELLLQQFRDQLKRDYCQKEKIVLIEIPYWEYKNGTLGQFLEENIKILYLEQTRDIL